jgi:antibiotic biosynthesis monooxygenase (ABM) superfamily enzyme
MSTQIPVSAPADSAAVAPVPAPAPHPAHLPSVHLPSVHTPSVHMRAAITWLAIFPLVAIGMTILAPLSESWHPALRALVLTIVVVPTAVYVVVPKLLAGYGSLKRRQARKATAKA